MVSQTQPNICSTCIRQEYELHVCTWHHKTRPNNYFVDQRAFPLVLIKLTQAPKLEPAGCQCPKKIECWQPEFQG